MVNKASMTLSSWSHRLLGKTEGKWTTGTRRGECVGLGEILNRPNKGRLWPDAREHLVFA